MSLSRPFALDTKRAQLHGKAVDVILLGTKWLSAAEAGILSGSEPTEVATWEIRGEVFAIDSDGMLLYPKYAFGPDGRPVPALHQVLETLVGLDAWGLAAWFESTSSYLGGARPRELLEQQAERVAAAARDHLLQMQG